MLNKIPEIGKIYLVKDGLSLPEKQVLQKNQKTFFAAGYKAEIRGWMLDILSCIEQIGAVEFSLKAIYQFEKDLQIRHPENHHIKEKIRQQFQLLRDHNLIEFSGKGIYKKLFR